MYRQLLFSSVSSMVKYANTGSYGKERRRQFLFHLTSFPGLSYSALTGFPSVHHFFYLKELHYES